MKKQMTLSTDRKSASEGEYLDIRWECNACPDSLYLSVDSGYQQYSIAVADNGSTRLAIGRSKSKTTISLIGVISGKKVTESVEIRIRNRKESRKAKTPLSTRMKAFGEKMQAKWYVFRAQMKYWWISQKKWQKALWIALLAIWLGLLFASLGGRPEPVTSSDQVEGLMQV
mgnify:CR=1 FL=1